MLGKKYTVVSIVVIALLIIPSFCENAYANSSSLESEITMGVVSDKVEISNFTPISGQIMYLNGSGYLEATFSNGMSLTLYSEPGRDYQIAIIMEDVDSRLIGKQILFKLGNESVNLRIDSAGKGVASTLASYSPSPEGLEVPLEITIPEFTGSQVSSIEMGTISFVLVREIAGNNVVGSRVVTDSNVVSVVVKNITKGGEVKDILSEINNLDTRDDVPYIPDAVSGDTKYNVIPVDNATNPTVLISYDGGGDKSITTKDTDFSFSFKVPANVMFYLTFNMKPAFEQDNYIYVGISNSSGLSFETKQIKGVTFANNQNIVSQAKSSAGMTVEIKNTASVSQTTPADADWIYTGSEEMTVSVHGHRTENGIGTGTDLQLRLVMKNITT